MWGTDLTATFTGEGQAAVFIAVDHCSAECVGIHPSSGLPSDRSRSVGTFASFAHARATRFEALEPIRQGVRRHFGGFAKAVASGLKLRHDHGSQYIVRALPEGDRLPWHREFSRLRARSGRKRLRRRFIRTLKENLLWGQDL
jgi:hypothetical protein